MSWFNILKISTEEAISDAKRFAPEMIEEGEKLNQEEKERNEKLQWEKFQPNLKKIINIFQEWLNKTPKDAYSKAGYRQINYGHKWQETLEDIEYLIKFMPYSNFEAFARMYQDAIWHFKNWPYKRNLHIGNDKVKEIERLRQEGLQ